ncbi:MAG: RnfABCDGE type electron transport complex subunit G [Clostridia bacterium]|nr:RnfABCDGE type electron transport complex subunit G [Clostridia bacterium]
MSSFTDFIKSNKDSIIKPTVVMVCICIVVTLALSLSNLVTAPKIKVLEEKTQKDAMSRVIKADNYKRETKDITFDGGDTSETVTYYTAKNSKKIIGYIFVMNEKGYGGDVSVMTAINTDGTVKAVDILDVSNETPGLGQNSKKESFYSQYKGLKNNISVVKNSTDSSNNEIQAVTGATITSKAVTKAVNKSLEAFKKVSKGGGK